MKTFKLNGMNFGTPYCEHYVFGTVKSHRNGISGMSFYTVSFRDTETGKTFIAIRFDHGEISASKENRIAVICQNDNYFAVDDISCWRGDNFVDHIDKAIKEHNDSWKKP